jgi:RimJ/RimL family protein N-acetyltransferase
MSRPHWPLFDLRVRTPRLELRYPDDELLVALLAVARRGIHDPSVMPFSTPWTRTPPEEFDAQFLRHHWGVRAGTTPEGWTVPLMVLVFGEVVGTQNLMARQFAVTRTFETGSWLGLEHQGRGIGTEMRAAALHLGFAGLGAELATTGSWDDNGPSQGVTRKLGYQDDGWTLLAREGAGRRMLRFRMERCDWAARRRHDIEVESLDGCRALLGIG